MRSYRKYVRRTAALLLACGLLTAQAWAAKITPSTTAVTLASGEQTFTVDVKLSEDNAFAGAEFGLDLPEGVTLEGVEFLDEAVQDANHSPEVTVEGRTFFGFYTAENTFSGEISVARLTFAYTGDDDTAFSLGSSKVVTVQEDGSTKGDTSAEPFTVRITRKGGSSGGSQPFADVAAGAYYADAVAWAADKGIVAGMSATTFAPNASITREQMAAILYRYAQFKGFDVTGRADLTAFADAASISAYAKESISWANAEGLISGRSAAELAPQGTATRAEAASILVRFQKNVK